MAAFADFLRTFRLDPISGEPMLPAEVEAISAAHAAAAADGDEEEAGRLAPLPVPHYRRGEQLGAESRRRQEARAALPPDTPALPCRAPAVLAELAESEGRVLNLDAGHLAAHGGGDGGDGGGARLYAQLVRYPQEIVPMFDIVASELLAEVAKGARGEGRQGLLPCTPSHSATPRCWCCCRCYRAGHGRYLRRRQHQAVQPARDCAREEEGREGGSLRVSSPRPSHHVPAPLLRLLLLLLLLLLQRRMRELNPIDIDTLVCISVRFHCCH